MRLWALAGKPVACIVFRAALLEPRPTTVPASRATCIRIHRCGPVTLRRHGTATVTGADEVHSTRRSPLVARPRSRMERAVVATAEAATRA